MKGFLSIAVTMFFALGLVILGIGPSNAAKGENPVVCMTTSQGDIVIELYPDKAPETVDNFMTYVNSKFYNGLIFHRVIPTFMIQGGGFTESMSRKEGNAPIKNEADNGLSNERGTIAMARTGEPHSATSQFFINVKDNSTLDFKSKSPQGWGYCVFGKVISGMDVVDKIKDVKTTSRDGYNDVPVEPILIEKTYQMDPDEVKSLKKK
jgi:peptidyl-prolyl cis-trans isomerase B (cyclophilin B)